MATAADTIDALAQTQPKLTDKERDALIMQWQDAAAFLRTYKDLEANLRARVTLACFGADIKNKDGTERLSLGMGYELKAVFKQNYKCGNVDKVTEAVDKLIAAAAEGEGKFIAQRLFKWEPDIRPGEYKKLPPNLKAIIDACITISPGAPSLELIEPPKKA